MNLNKLRLPKFYLQELVAYLPNAVLGAGGATGPTGPVGATGPTGPAGPLHGTMHQYMSLADSGLSYPVWHSLITNAWQQGVQGNSSITKDVLRAYPIVIGRTCLFTQMRIYVSAAAAGGVGRMGLYSDAKNSKSFPKSRLAQSPEFTTSLTSTWYACTFDSGVTLSPGLYWVALWLGVGNPTIGSNPPTYSGPVCGQSILGWNLSTTYSAAAELPSTFPAAALSMTHTSQFLPDIGLRLETPV